MKLTRQQQTDAYQTAQFIAKHADLYERCPIFRFMVDATVYFTPEEIHESMGVTGWQFINSTNPESRVWDDEIEECII